MLYRCSYWCFLSCVYAEGTCEAMSLTDAREFVNIVDAVLIVDCAQQATTSHSRVWCGKVGSVVD